MSKIAVKRDGPRGWHWIARENFDPAVHVIHQVDPLDHDGDGKSGGSVKGYHATAAKGATTRAVTGIGDEAKLVSVKATKDDEDYRDVTLIARWSNVVLVVSYNGAGFEGSKTPSAKTVEDGAVKAAKEAIAAVG